MSDDIGDTSPVNVAPIIAPDQGAMIEHLTMLFGRAQVGRIEITAIHTDKIARHSPRTQFFSTDQFDEAATFAAAVNRQPGWNVYVGAALRIEEVFPGQAADDSDFLETYAVWADADDGEQMAFARQVYRELLITPAMVVVTGQVPSTRAQLWWPLENPIRDISVLRATLRGIATTLKTDGRVLTGKQLMRLAGGVNWPKKDGRVLERTQIIIPRNSNREFMLEQIHRAFPPAERSEPGEIGDVTIEAAGALGLTEKVMDGRELYAFRLVRAHLREWIGTTGSEPTADELYKDVAPVYLKKADQVRPGRGPDFLKQKCTEAIRAFREGQIPGMTTLDEAVTGWVNRHVEPQQLESPDQPRDIFDPWERYPTPSFPLHALPDKLASFVRLTAASVGGDPSAVAMAALTTCSAAVDQEFRLIMKRSGTWRVPPRLWTLLVGDPSSKKTPIISGCVAPLRRAEKAHVDAYRKDHARWLETKKDSDDSEPPKPLRHVFNSITVEKLGEILGRQSRGALVEYDEVSGWIGSMDKYSGGKGGAADRSFWLQAYNGGFYTVDRVGRGESFIDNLCISFIGGVQPSRLSELGGLTSDGLLQRFLPVMMGDSSFPQEVEDEFALAAYDNLIKRLLDKRPTALKASDGALRAFEAFQRQIHSMERMTALGEHFCAFLGKLTGVQGSLALLLHLMGDDGQFEPVSEEAAENATLILNDFVIPHALEFYSATLDKGDWSGLRALASFVITSSKDRFTAADFTGGVYAMRGLGVWELTQKVSPLVAGGWLIEDSKSVPARAWIMADGVRELLNDRREKEVTNRANTLLTLKAIRSKVTSKNDSDRRKP